MQFNKQIIDIYWAAYYWYLNHQPIAITPATQANMLKYILKFVIGNLEKRKLHISFFAFKHQDKPFDITNKI